MLGVDHDSPSQGLYIGVLVAAAVLGNLFVLPIGGADMPVVISLLNSYTGLAAAATGFAMDNVVLIVAGTLVGVLGNHPHARDVQGDEPLDLTNVLFAASAP